MFFIIIFLLTLGGLLVKWRHQDRLKYAKCPPGPKKLPIIGNAHQLFSPDELTVSSTTLTRLSQKWGDIISLKVGNVDAVVVSSLEAAHKVLSHECSVDRVLTSGLKIRSMNQNLGINFSNGHTWATLRRFTIRNLREFGFGKSSLDMIICDHANKLMSQWELELDTKSEIEFRSNFKKPVLALTLELLSGQKLNSLETTKVLECIEIFNENTTVDLEITTGFPFLGNWLPSKIKEREQQIKSAEYLRQFARAVFERQRESQQKGTAEPSYVDAFVQQIYSEKNENDVNDPFTVDQFVLSLLDLNQNAVGAISTALTFAVLYAISFPETQAKIHEEIDKIEEKIGHNEMDYWIGWEAHSKLPYTYAFLMETFRYSSFFPTIAPRQATQDFYLHEYKIFKGSWLIVNLHGMNTCERKWPCPEQFNPERFLLPNGSLDMTKTQQILPFGGGKRSCPGQEFARQTLFIYFTTILKTFKFSSTNANLCVQPSEGLIRTPKSFRALVEKRQSNNNHVVAHKS